MDEITGPSTMFLLWSCVARYLLRIMCVWNLVEGCAGHVGTEEEDFNVDGRKELNST